MTHHASINAGCRARRRLPRGHGVATRALRRHHGRRRALPRSLPRPAQLQRTRKLKHSCANRRVFFLFLISVREISVTDVVFCLTRTGACPARGVWPRGATELPVGTDDDGTHALRSLRAASGRRAVVSLLLICVWAICIDVVFCSQGTDGTQRRLLALALHRRLMRGDG